MDKMNAGYDQPQSAEGYTNPSPGYTNPSQVVVTQPYATTFTTQEVEPRHSWCHLVLGVIGFLLCCPICGMVATVMSLLSYTDHRVKDFAKYNSKRGIALGFGIAAMILGAIMWIATIIVLTEAASAATNAQYETYG